MHAVLIGPYPPPQGGVQTHVVALRRHLLGAGVKVSVISVARHTGDRNVEGVSFPRSGREVLKLLFRLRPDLIHAHVGGTLPWRVLAMLLATTLVPGARTVLTFHSGGYPSSGAGRRTRRWTPAGLVLGRLDALVAVNREIAAWFERVGVSPARIHCISPFGGLPGQRADDVPLPADLDAFFREHDPVFTTVGLLEPEYDLELQLDALAEVRRHRPAAGLVMVGSGSRADALRDRLRLRSPGAHALLTGDLPHSLALEIVRRSDVMLRTTRYDGDALSVREGLALGVPVIATDTGMRPDGVSTVPVGDRVALVEAMLSFTRGDAPDRVPTHAVSGGSGALEDVVKVYQELLRARREVPDRPAGLEPRRSG